MSWVRVIIGWIWVLLPAWAAAQFDLSTHAITIADGLPSNTIYCISQDQNGAIWIGHDRGISRYNGLGFRHFHPPQGEVALSGITPLGGDSVLAHTFGGESILCTEDTIMALPKLKRPQNSFPLFRIAYGTRLATCLNEILLIKRDFSPNILLSQSDLAILDACFRDDSTLWVFASIDGTLGVSSFSLNTHTFSEVMKVNSQGRGFLFPWGHGFFLYLSGEGKLLGIHEDGLREIPMPAGLPGLKTNCVIPLNDTVAAIATYTGIVLINPRGEITGHYLKDYSISWMFRDRANNLWLGTLEDGIRLVPNLDLTRLELSQYFKNAKAYSHLVLGGDSLLLGTYDGKLLWIDQNGTLMRTTDLGIAAEVQSLWLDEKRRSVWVYSDDLQQIDLRTGNALHKWGMTSTKAILCHKGKVFCATSVGVHVLDNGSWSYHLKEEWIRGMELDDNDGLILLGRKATYRLNLRNNAAQPERMNFAPGLPSTFVQVRKGRGGELLLLAPQSGLYRWRNGTMELVLSLERNGLREISRFAMQGDVFYGISRDILWMHDGSWTSLDLSQSLAEGDLRDVEVTDHGIYLFSPRMVLRLGEMPLRPSPSCRLFLREWESTYQLHKGSWTSEHSGNRLHLGWEALPSSSYPANGRIQYRLSGQDTLWQDAEMTDSLQWIRLDRLEAGSYSLELRVHDAKGTVVAPHIIRLVVKPPLYARALFWLLTAGALAAVVYAVVRWRIRRLHRKNLARLEQERLKINLLSAELKAIRSQMNPHFIFNSLSAIQAKVLAADSESAFDDLSSFSKLLRSVLEYSSREYILLDEEVRFLELYLKLESGRFGDRFHWELEVDDELQDGGVRIPTLISQPFVENALRHGLLHKEGPQRLWIIFAGRPGDFTITIRDNGVGRRRSAEINAGRSGKPKSFATKAILQRVEYLAQSGGPTVTVETIDLDEGTEVRLHIHDEQRPHANQGTDS